MSVDAAFGRWLQDQYRYAEAASDAVAASWGDLAVAGEIGTPLRSKADALAEAARQHNFMIRPMVIDTIEVPGARVDLIGKRLTFFADDGGYAQGVTVFVIAAEEQSDVNATTLTVLKRLA